MFAGLISRWVTGGMVVCRNRTAWPNYCSRTDINAAMAPSNHVPYCACANVCSATCGFLFLHNSILHASILATSILPTSILARMEWPFSASVFLTAHAQMLIPFCMLPFWQLPFWPEWNFHSSQNGMALLGFRRNERCLNYCHVCIAWLIGNSVLTCNVHV